MDLKFEKFIPAKPVREQKRNTNPCATIASNGIMFFNKAATTLFDLKPGAFSEIYYSRAGKIIAIKFVAHQTDSAVRFHRASTPSTSRVNVNGLVKMFNIKKGTQNSLKVTRDADTGMLMVHGVEEAATPELAKA